MSPGERPALREWISRAYTVVEDVVYVGLGLLLSALVLSLLVLGAIELGSNLFTAQLPMKVVALLDRILLILLIVELLYTVQVSFRAHSLTPEPFLLVGLISCIRRVLLLTTALGEQHQQKGEEAPMSFLIELGVLTALILALSLALFLLRKRPVKAKRS